MVTLVIVLVIAALLFYGYKQYKSGKLQQTLATKGSAFARVAEQDGKLIALKAVTEAKLLEAKARHAALDEVDKLLG